MQQATPTFIDTPLLRIACEQRGPSHGKPVVLLHGWPDDVRTWDRIIPALVERGYRTIAPWLRGYGATAFREARTMRSGQVVAFAQDVIDMLDAMNLDRVSFVGHDWGARAGYALAALFPERIERLIAISSGYETGIKSGEKIKPEQAKAYWYQWFWNTRHGAEALEGNRRDYCRLLWQTWSPKMKFADDEFHATADAWDNPDWVAGTLHAYRVRWGNAPRDLLYEPLEKRIENHPKIPVPTTVIHGQADGASLAESSAGQEKDFTAGYARIVLPNVGHFVQREEPQAVVDAICKTSKGSV